MKKQNKQFIWVVIGAVLAYRAYFMSISFINTNKPSGWKYNNVGNIRPSSRLFRGELFPSAQTSSSGKFRRFKTYYYGAVAYCKLLRDVYLSEGKDTIRRIITKYAPPSENDTENYIRRVSEFSGIAADEIILFADRKKFLALAAAMVRFENGEKEAFLLRIFSIAYFDVRFLSKK